MVRLVHGEGEEKRLNEDRRFGLVVWTGGNILYSREVNLVLYRSKHLMLVVACSLVFGLIAAVAMASPAPQWSDLALANDYGHVTYTFNPLTRVYTFTVFNDMTTAGWTIGGFAVYPTALLTGIVPVVEGPSPVGWMAVGWEGPVTGLVPQFGNIRDSFISTLSVANVGPSSSLNSFTIEWIGTNLPTDLQFGVLVSKPGNAFWAEAGPSPCEPIPDASTLILAMTGCMALLPAFRLRRREV